MFWMLNVLDYVPIVGSLKQGVHAAIAISKGNKQEAVIKTLEATVGLGLDIATFGTYGTIGKVIIKQVAKQTEKVVVKEATLLATNTAINIGTRVFYGQKKYGSDIATESTEREIAPITHRYAVINHNVLRVIPHIIDVLAQRLGSNMEDLVHNERFGDNSLLMQAYNSPVSPESAHLIQHVLAVFIDENEREDNQNGDTSLQYGQRITHLADTITTYMHSIYRENDTVEAIGVQARNTAENFIDNQYFVDRTALRIWIRDNPENGNAQYNSAYNEVVGMFRNLVNFEIISLWMNELRHAITNM